MLIDGNQKNVPSNCFSVPRGQWAMALGNVQPHVHFCLKRTREMGSLWRIRFACEANAYFVSSVVFVVCKLKEIAKNFQKTETNAIFGIEQVLLEHDFLKQICLVHFEKLQEKILLLLHLVVYDFLLLQPPTFAKQHQQSRFPEIRNP